MIKMPFLLLNNLNDINCGHVRKCVMRSIIFWTILFIRFGSKLYRQIFGIPMGTNCALARRLRAKFWPDCAIPDTSMKFGTAVDTDLLSTIGYRTTLGNAYCACAKHFLILGCYHRAFIQFDFKEGVMLAVE